MTEDVNILYKFVDMAKHILNIPIYKIVDSPFQGRFFDDESLKNENIRKSLDELVESIRTSGLMQPIIVRLKDDKYEVVDGHRRIRAYRELDKGNIPAIVKEASDKDVQIMTVIANIQRSNLSNLEKAMAFEKILSEGVFKTKKELSKAIGKDETYVGDIMNLLKLDKRILQHLATGKNAGDVRLLRLIRKAGKVNNKGYNDAQYDLYLKHVYEKLDRDKLKALLDKKLKNQPKQKTKAEPGQASSKKQQNQPSKQKIVVRNSYNGFNLQMKEKLNKKQKDELRGILEQKIQEVWEEFYKREGAE